MPEPHTIWRGAAHSANDMARFGHQLAPLLQPGDWVLLKGTLGSGKTTLARAILQALGHPGEVPSPSFTLVQSYAAPPLQLAIAHVDLYRLASPAEVAALALDELADEAALLIEWPERLGGWPADALLVEIGLNATDGHAHGRQLVLTGAAPWHHRLAAFNFA